MSQDVPQDLTIRVLSYKQNNTDIDREYTVLPPEVLSRAPEYEAAQYEENNTPGRMLFFRDTFSLENKVAVYEFNRMSVEYIDLDRAYSLDPQLKFIKPASEPNDNGLVVDSISISDMEYTLLGVCDALNALEKFGKDASHLLNPGTFFGLDPNDEDLELE